MNENIEIMENNNIPQSNQSPKKSKGPIIIIVLLILIIGGLTTFIVINKDKIFNSNNNNENNTEVKEEKKNDGNNSKKNEKINGYLDIQKTSDNVELKINDKKCVLTFERIEMDSDEELVVKLDSKKIFSILGFGDYDGNYQILTLNDEKQYLIINYSGGSGNYQYLIIDNTGNILYRINNEEENKIPSEAYGIMLEKDKLNFKVDNGYIYYYRLKKMISLDNQTAILEEVKLSINDGKINITPTGNEKETKVSYN